MAEKEKYFDVAGMDSDPRPATAPALVKAAMSNSKIVMAGDTNHFNGDIIGLAQSPAMLSAARDGGATHIAIEVDQGLQHMADKYVAGKISRKDLETSVHRMYQDAQNNENGEFTRTVLNTVDFAKNNNMSIVFADPHNGWGNKPGGLSPEEDAKWTLENNRDRFRDTELVERLNGILDSNKDAKVYLAYGDAHFSVDNGNKDSLNGPLTKISLYSDREDLANFEKGMQDPNAYGRTMGWMGVKPDLAYFMKEQTFATTNETSNAVRKAVDDLAAKPQSSLSTKEAFQENWASMSKPSKPAPSQEQDVNSPRAAYIERDNSQTTLTSETAFNKAASGLTPAPDQGIEISNPALQQKTAPNAPTYLKTAAAGP